MKQLVWRFHPITNHLTTMTNISSLPMTLEFRAKSLTCHLVQSRASVWSSPLWVLLFSVVKKLPNCPWAHLLLLFSQLWIFSFFFQFLLRLCAPFPPSNSPALTHTHTRNVYFIHLNNSTSVQCFSLPIQGNYWKPSCHLGWLCTNQWHFKIIAKFEKYMLAMSII